VECAGLADKRGIRRRHALSIPKSIPTSKIRAI
jgi:hypothetical protein